MITTIALISQVTASHSPSEAAARLERGLQAVADGERDAPRDRWDPRYVVEQRRSNPDVIHKFLQDTPRGVPRGSVDRRTTTLKHQANPKLGPEQFRFEVPAS